MPIVPHPLYQYLYHEPRIPLPEQAAAVILILPPASALPSQLDSAFLASHLVPILPANASWPKPRSSLSASSVLSRITSPRTEPSHRFQKTLPVKPRSQSLIGQQPPTHLFASTPPPPSTTMQHTNATHKRRQFVTLNDKVLFIGDNKMTTGEGFPTATRVTVLRTRQVSVQLGHVKSSGSLLQPHQDKEKEQKQYTHHELPTFSALVVPLLLVYIDRPIWVEQSPISRPNRLQNNLQELLDGFDDQLFPNLSKIVQEASDEAIHIEHLDTLHTIIENLIETGSQMLHKLPITSMIMQDQIHAAFESYVMEQTYDIVFFKITQVVLTRDLHLSEVIEQIKHVDVTQLGLPTAALKDARRRVNRAVPLFQNIGAYRTPFEKLDCILSTIRLLSSSSSKYPSSSSASDTLTATYKSPSISMPPSPSASCFLDTTDSLVPLLLLTVIQSRVPHLTAHWTYMKEYTFERDVIGGKYGFALSTLEGVLAYISDSAISQLATVSHQNLQLWRCLKNTTTFQQDNRRHMETLYAQCHPIASLSAKHTMVIRDRQGNTPLQLACRSGQLAYVPFLAQYEPDVTTVTNEYGETTLMLAVLSGSTGLVHYLLTQFTWTKEQLDAKGNHKDRQCDATLSSASLSPLSSFTAGRSAIHLTAYLHPHDTSIIELLLCHGASSDILDDQHNGPLHLACLSQQPTQSSSSLNSTLKELQTSPTSTSTAMLDYLLRHLPPAARQQPNSCGETFFHLCQHQSLLEKYQDELVDTLDQQGRSPWLAWAADGRFQAMMTLMNHHNVDQFRLDYQGRCALHYVGYQLHLLDKERAAAASRFVYALKDLVLVRDQLDGNTPLHMVALSTKGAKRAPFEMYRLFMESLLENGASINACNHAEQTPIDICDSNYLCILESWCLRAKPKAPSDETNRMHQPWAVTQVVTDPVRYIIKSGKTIDDISGMTTVERSWDDFLFLRQELLHELPELFLPTIGSNDNDNTILDPSLIDLCPPPLMLLQKALRRLDLFMDYLQRHPVLRKHDQVRGFTRTPHLNKAAIHDRSFSRRNLMIENLGATLPSYSPADDFDEVYFLKYSQGMIRPLREGLATLVQRSQQLLQYQQGMEDTQEQMTQQYGQLTWLNTTHQEAIKVCVSLACNTMYVSPLISLVDGLETMNDTTNGVLLALEHPFSLLKRKNELVQQLEKQRDSLQKGQHPPWNGLFSTLEQTKQVERDKENIAKTLLLLGTTRSQITQSHQMISDELAHYQRLHPDEMLKSIRSYARRQLKMEKLKLRWLNQTLMNVKGNQ